MNNVQTITSTGDTIQGTFRHQVAYTLLERETLEEDEAYAAAGISPGTVPAASAHAKAG